MRKGEKQAAGRHRTLVRTVEQAEARAETEAMAEIRAAWQRGEWRAAAWWLERRRPETYREQKGQGDSAATEDTIVRIIYEAEVAWAANVFSSAYAVLDAQNNRAQQNTKN